MEKSNYQNEANLEQKLVKLGLGAIFVQMNKIIFIVVRKKHKRNKSKKNDNFNIYIY